MRTTGNKEIFVGIGVITGFLLLMAYFYGGKSMAAQATEGYRLTAAFNKVDGLFPGDAVRMGGIKIGIVESQKLDKNFRAVITFRINGNVKLPKDTSVAIHTDGLFGSKFVIFEPGGDETNLKDGDFINFAQDAVILSELLDLIISQGKANLKKLESKQQKEGK
ncbi:MAG: MlaD family protein [Rhodospirillales bacterium]